MSVQLGKTIRGVGVPWVGGEHGRVLPLGCPRVPCGKCRVSAAERACGEGSLCGGWACVGRDDGSEDEEHEPARALAGRDGTPALVAVDGDLAVGPSTNAQAQQLDAEEHGSQRPDAEEERQCGQQVARRQRGSGRDEVLGRAERDPQKPARRPHSGEDHARDRRLRGN